MYRGLVIVALLTFAWNSRANTNIPIYVNIAMHNEETLAYATNPNYFNTQRTQLVAFANMLYSNNVMFNWQSDWTFLSGVTNFDPRGPDTQGTTVVAWLQYHLGFEVDPHAHESTRSYADVAYALVECGIATQDLSHTVGGFIAHPNTNSILDHVRYTITGYVHTAFTWEPEILWGGGTGNHVDETNLWSSGIWRPKGTNEFKVHDPAAPLPCIGNFGAGTQKWVNLERLLAWRAAGLLCSNKLYTCLIMTNHRDLSDAFRTNFAAQLQPFKTNANVHWVGVAEAVDLWRTAYGEEPCILPSDLSLDVDNDGLDDGWEVAQNCDITWSDGAGDFDGDALDDAAESVADTDPLDASNYFRIENSAFSTAAGRMYRVETTTNLFSGWTTSHVAIGTGGLISLTNNGAADAAFYRVVVSRP